MIIDIKVKSVPFDSLKDGDTFWWIDNIIDSNVERRIVGDRITYADGSESSCGETVESYKGEDVFVRV